MAPAIASTFSSCRRTSSRRSVLVRKLVTRDSPRMPGHKAMAIRQDTGGVTAMQVLFLQDGGYKKKRARRHALRSRKERFIQPAPAWRRVRSGTAARDHWY